MARRSPKTQRATGKGKLGRLGRIVEFSFYAVSIGVLLAILCGGVLIFAYSRDLPTLEPLIRYTAGDEWRLATKVFAADDSLIGEFYEEDRLILPIDRVPEVMRKAVIAVEDERFDRNHPTAWVREIGIDPIGILRAAVKNVMARRVVEGGSTITQQLTKNLFLTKERKIGRKIQEAILAYRIEKEFSRDEILERYLNKIFFGNQAYGIHSAAYRYFKVDLEKPGSTLTLGQAAMLAGLPKAPSAYAPHRHPRAARERQKVVLERMAECGYISRNEIDSAVTQFWETFDTTGVTVPDTAVEEIRVRAEQADFFLQYVRQELIQLFGPDGEEEIKRGGYRVKTTLDPRAQRAAESAMKSGLARLSGEIRKNGISLAEGPLEGALVALDHKTGRILAMVGGSSWSTGNQFNRAVQAKRQAGSSFKPFVYFSGVKRGALTLGTVLRDDFFQVPGTDWTPQNYDGTSHGPVLPRRALQHSYNIAAVRALLLTSPEEVIDDVRGPFAMDARNMMPYPSLALGAFEVSPLDMAQAYAVFANNGVRIKPSAILEIRDHQGRLINSFEPFPTAHASDPAPVFLLRSMMQTVVQAGTAASNVGARLGNIPAAGKTGTTDDYADAWFCGFTPEVTAVAWVGFDRRRAMGRGMTGGHAGGRIWADFVRDYYKDAGLRTSGFPEPPPGVIGVRICDLTGLVPSPDCPSPTVEYFLGGTGPTEICAIHSDPYALMTFLYGAEYADSAAARWPGDINAHPALDELTASRERLEDILQQKRGLISPGGVDTGVGAPAPASFHDPGYPTSYVPPRRDQFNLTN